MLPMESQPRLLNLSPRHIQKDYLLDMSPTPTKRVAIYAPGTKIVNAEIERPVTYNTYRYYIAHDEELKPLLANGT